MYNSAKPNTHHTIARASAMRSTQYLDMSAPRG